MITDHLYSFLNAQTAITDLVGTRMYPVILPAQPTYPALTFRDSDHELDEDFDGMGSPVESNYFIDAWGSTYAEATSVADAVRSSLNNTRGNFGGIQISRCVVTSGPIPIYEDAVEAYRITQIFLIVHKEE